MGAAARLPVGRDDVQSRRQRGAPGHPAVGARLGLPVGPGLLLEGCDRRAPGGAEVGAAARLPVGFEDVCICRTVRAPEGVVVGVGARLPVHVEGRRYRREAAGASVVGWCKSPCCTLKRLALVSEHASNI